MRKLTIVGLIGLTAGCTGFPIATDQTPPSPSELDEMSARGCQMWPNTNEWLECRRRTTVEREPAYEGPKPRYPRGYE